MPPGALDRTNEGTRPAAVSARRAHAPIRLALARVRHRWRSEALVALGLALGAATLAVVLGGGLVARDHRLTRALNELPAGERSVQVAHFGLPAEAQGYEALDSDATRVLARLGLQEPIRVVQFKALQIGGSEVIVAALDGLPRRVRLTSGRLPRLCRPTRCEVIIVGRRDAPAATPAVPIVAVGHGQLVSELPFGRLGRLGSSSETLGSRRPPLLALAEGVEQLAALPSLSAIYRTYAWIAPLRADALHPWQAEAFLDDLARGKSALQGASGGFDVAAPAKLLEAEADTGRRTSQRLLLIGGQTVALLLAFAIFAAGTMKRDLEASLRRLTWCGARRWQLALLTGVEVSVLAVGSVAAGWILGTLATAAVADEAGSPAFAVIRHALISWSGVATAAVLAVAASTFLLVTIRASGLFYGGPRVTPLDVAALGALAAIAIGSSLGQADAERLVASGGTGAFLLVLPGLVLIVVAVGCARLLAPLLRLIQRFASRSAVPLRLAALSLARRPGRAVVTASFLVVSVGLAFFSFVYRSTLVGGIDDQVDYAFPYDFIVREDLAPDRLVRPLDAAPLARYRTLAPGTHPIPVIRQRASFSRIATIYNLTVLALPSGELANLPGWRADFSDLGPAEIARRLAPPPSLRLSGIRLPTDARALTVPVSMSGDDIVLSASTANRDGGFTTLVLGQTRGLDTHVLRAPLPREARGGLFLGFRFGRPTAVEGHAKGDVLFLRGLLKLGALEVERSGGRRTMLARDYGEWMTSGAVEVIGARGNTIGVGVSSSAESGLRLRQPTDGTPIPAIVTPELAANASVDGIMPVRAGSGLLHVRVAGVARRFPTIDGDFLLVDERALSVALNAGKAGAAVVNEVWVDAPTSQEAAAGAALRKPPFSVLDTREKRPFERTLRDDPLARGTLLLVLGGAATAFVLALVAVVLFLAADLRDERGEFFDLEAQGVGPVSLRRHLWLRVLLVAVPGFLGGGLAAAALSALVVDFVALTAGATVPNPPLLLRVDWPLVLAVLAGYALIAAGTVALVARWAFRAPSPGPATA